MIACVYLPEFAVTAMRAESQAGTQPLILFEETRQKARVYAASVKARASGVTSGMALSRAQALCPAAVVAPVVHARLQQAADALLERCSCFSDRLEMIVDHMGLLFVDFRNLALPAVVAQAQALRDDLSAYTPYSAAVGLAANRFTAQIAAVTVPLGQTQPVPSGQEAAFLAHFPLARLAVGPTLVYQFRILGLHTLGQVAALPKDVVHEHFGTVGRQLYERARGIDMRPVANYTPRRIEQWGLEFETGIEDRQLLERVLRRAGETLAERLKRQQLAAGQITLLIHLESHQTLEYQQQPREAALSVFALSTELLRLLKTAVIATPVAGLEVVLDDLNPPVPYQLSFLGQLFADSSSVDTVVNQLQPRHPTSAFYSIRPQPHPSYIPEQCFVLERIGGA